MMRPVLKSLLPALFATAVLAGSVSAQSTDIAKMSDAEREAFRSEIRAYLLENPEVLIEAIQVLETRQEAEQAANDDDLIAANAADLFEDKASWQGGNPEGDITIVEFLDYQCGYCKRAFPEVMSLVNSDKNIRLIVKEFPILGEASMLASQFAVAVLQVAGDDAYQAVHDGMMMARGGVNDALIDKLIADNDLDGDAIRARMGGPEVEAVIRANRELGQRMKINGTPSFVFETEMVRGYVPLDGMTQLIAELRSR